MSTPYNGTEGYSGTDTSRERAESKSEGAKRRQNQLLAYLRAEGVVGATVAEIKDAASLLNGNGRLPREFEHHGTASGTLSILHRAGKIARLTGTRNGAHVYVLPEHIDDRPYERFVGNRERAMIAALDEAVTDLEDVRKVARPVDRLGLDVATHRLRARIERLVAGDADA